MENTELAEDNYDDTEIPTDNETSEEQFYDSTMDALKDLDFDFGEDEEESETSETGDLEDYKKKGGPDEEDQEDGKQEVEPEKIKLKVDGKEIEVTQDELVEYASKHLGSENRLEDAKKARQDAATARDEAKDLGEQIVQRKQQHAAFVKSFSSTDYNQHMELYEMMRQVEPNIPPFHEIALRYAVDYDTFLQMTPEQQKAFKLERENQSLQKRIMSENAQKEQQLKLQEEEQGKYQTEQWTTEIDQSIASSFKELRVPMTKGNVVRYIELLEVELEKPAGQRATSNQLAKQVLDEFTRYGLENLNNLEASQLEERLEDLVPLIEILDKIRLSQRGEPNKVRKTTPNDVKKSNARANQPLTEDEWAEQKRRIIASF